MVLLSIILWIVSALVLVLSIGYFFIQKRFLFWSDNGIPHIEGSLPSGSLNDIGKKYHMAEQLQIWYNKFKKEGNPAYAGIYFFLNPVVLAMNCDLIKTILVKDFNHFMDRQIYYNEKDDPLSAHLAALQGNRWKNLRSKLTPTFTSGKLKSMLPIVVGVADEFRKVLGETIKTEKELDMRDILGRFTTDVIGSCAFGIDCNSLKDPNGEFRKFGKLSAEKSRHPTLIMLFMTTFRKLANFLKMKVVLDDVSDFFLGAIKNTIEVREKNNIKRNDFMNMLIELKNNGKLEGDSSSVGSITFDELAAQAFVFFGAGFETSSTTMSYTLYELSLNHDIQNKAREEVLRVLEKYDGVMSYEAVTDMKYIEQIISETLRKYPVAATINRIMTSDQYKMPGTNQIIKKGQHVIIPTYAIQHDPEHYPDPETYDPMRFSEEESNKRNPFSYLPFGDGPRSCIGLRFGMIQAKVGLASLLRDFKFNKCSKSVFPMVFNPQQHILMPKGGMWLNVEKYN